MAIAMICATYNTRCFPPPSDKCACVFTSRQRRRSIKARFQVIKLSSYFTPRLTLYNGPIILLQKLEMDFPLSINLQSVEHTQQCWWKTGAKLLMRHLSTLKKIITCDLSSRLILVRLKAVN